MRTQSRRNAHTAQSDQNFHVPPIAPLVAVQTAQLQAMFLRRSSRVSSSDHPTSMTLRLAACLLRCTIKLRRPSIKQFLESKGVVLQEPVRVHAGNR